MKKFYPTTAIIASLALCSCSTKDSTQGDWNDLVKDQEEAASPTLASAGELEALPEVRSSGDNSGWTGGIIEETDRDLLGVPEPSLTDDLEFANAPKPLALDAVGTPPLEAPAPRRLPELAEIPTNPVPDAIRPASTPSVPVAVAKPAEKKEPKPNKVANPSQNDPNHPFWKRAPQGAEPLGHVGRVLR